MLTALLVAVGGATGTALRFAVGTWLPGRRSTLLVNVVGSAGLGALVGSTSAALALLGIGLCGGLTTFSTFAVEAAALDRAARRYAVATVLLCLGAAALTRSVVGAPAGG